MACVRGVGGSVVVMLIATRVSTGLFFQIGRGVPFGTPAQSETVLAVLVEMAGIPTEFKRNPPRT